MTPLFVPGDRPDRFGKAAASGTDAIILDLEDAVEPGSKDTARMHVVAHNLPNRLVIVRINALASPWFGADLKALANVPIGAVMLPKAETSDDVKAVHETLGRPIPVLPLIETARGLAQLPDVLSAEGVSQAAFGSIDFAVDVGCAHTWEALLFARSEIVFRSRLAGRFAPIDGVTAALDDDAVVEAEARRGAGLGFAGKLVVHPRQLAPIRRAFQPNEQAQAWARKVIQAAESGAAIRVDGMMVDRPVLEHARRILAVASASTPANSR